MKVCDLGASADYQATWQAMRDFTDSRDEQTADEIWYCQHSSVYTLGQAAKREHILNSANIPVVQTDRGGQVTWHGPGQLVVYPLVNVRRRNIGVRQMVNFIEQSIINVLADLGQEAYSRADAPGVYIPGSQGEAKIAALGLRIRKGCSYHGLSLNIENSLDPFVGINPCGDAGMAVTTCRDQGILEGFDTITSMLLKELMQLP